MILETEKQTDNKQTVEEREEIGRLMILLNDNNAFLYVKCTITSTSPCNHTHTHILSRTNIPTQMYICIYACMCIKFS